MTRKLNGLGLALVAAIALVAIIASSASAAAFKCESLSERCVLAGTTETAQELEILQHDTWRFAEFISECHGDLLGTQATGSSASITVKPSYSNCTQGEHVRTNHCAYVFGTTTTNGDAPVTLECAANSKIELDDTGICTLTFGEQNTLEGGVHYTNTGNSTVTVEATITNLKYKKSNQTGNQFFCGLIPNGPAEFVSKTTVHCYQDSGFEETGTGKTTPLELHSEFSALCKYEA